jgi:hypothetical protein
MEIYEYFNLSRILLSIPLEVSNNPLEFWKEMVSIGLLINIPVAIEVISLNTSPTIP